VLIIQSEGNPAGFKELFIVKMEERSDEHLRNEKRD
jgi:hypothetical protein